MKMKCRWQYVTLAGLGLALTGLTGCQTWVAGMTLPSGRYLQHPPQYIAPSPAFPLQRELASMEAQTAGPAAAAPAPGGAVPAPNPVVPAQPPAAAPVPPPVPER
jgi:hypothetical protein